MEPISKLNSYINSAIPYAWDDSESWFEFMAKVLHKVNELIEANNAFFAVDIATYVNTTLTQWLDNGTIHNMIIPIVGDALNYITNLTLKNYGAVGDGITDDTQSIIDAIAAAGGRKLMGESGKTYLTTSKINLPNNTHIDGNGCIFLNKPKSEFYNINDGLFSAHQQDNIRLENCVFDGGAVAFPRTNGQGNQTGNGLVVFDSCSNVTLNNCRWQNYNQAWGDSLDFTKYHVVAFRYCNFVNIVNCVQRDVYPEGLALQNCTQIYLNRFVVNNLMESTVWTPLHMFYCDKVIVNDVYLKSVSVGSTFNFTCQNFVIRNIQLDGGGGLDMSNESDVPYQVKNGLIDGIIINGGYLYTAPTNGGAFENVIIKNGIFNPIGRSIIFRMDSPKNVTIQDCRVNSDRGALSNTNLIRLVWIDIGADCGGLTLNNVNFEGDVNNLIEIVLNDAYKTFTGLYINNVKGSLNRSPDVLSANGNGSLLYIYNRVSNNIDYYVDDIKINNSNIMDITGSVMCIDSYGHIKELHIIGSEISGNNDRAGAWPLNMFIDNSKLQFKLFISATTPDFEKMIIKNSVLRGYSDTNAFIRIVDDADTTKNNLIIKDVEILDMTTLINVVYGRTSLNPLNSRIEVSEDFITATSVGASAIRNLWMKNGVLGYKSNIVKGTTANRLTAPIIGQMMFDTTLNIPIWWNGTTWRNSAGVEV